MRPRSRRKQGGDSVRYTIRNLPRDVDRALRRKAKERKVSLNEILRAALMREAGLVPAEREPYRDLDSFIGSWQEDPEFDAILAEQDRVDPDR